MSSFSKNVLPRRAHRERSQPSRRVARHGLLEKKKDYKLRARDASRKRRRVQLLKEKAAFRNPDEFYHAMARGSTDAGVVRKKRDGDGGHHVADGDIRRLVETQDRAYVRVKVARERSRIEKGKANLHFLEAAALDDSRRHTVFVGESEDEGVVGGAGNEGAGDSAIRGVGDFDREEFFERQRAWGKEVRAGRVDDELDEIEGKDEEGDVEEEGVIPRPRGKEAKLARKKAGRRGYVELEQRIERVNRLDTAMEDLELRNNLLGKGARRKVKAGDPQAGILPVFKWKKVRKR